MYPDTLTRIDSTISDLQAAISQLETQRVNAQLKDTAVQRATESAQEILSESGYDLEDMFEALAPKIRQWIVSQKGADDGIWQALKSHYMLHSDANIEPKTKGGKDSLPPGTYLNPWNGDTVEKVTRSPKKLMEWTASYGELTVETWRA